MAAKLPVYQVFRADKREKITLCERLVECVAYDGVVFFRDAVENNIEFRCGSRKVDHRIDVLYLDAPVMNLLSCPAGLGMAQNMLYAEYEEATGMTMSDLICYREHPIDKMHLLLENKIPVVLVYGDSDTVVPYKENGALLEKYYKENGGVIEVYGKAGCAHHPHGLEDNTPIIEFVEKYSI